jgi:hypothetical protein
MASAMTQTPTAKRFERARLQPHGQSSVLKGHGFSRAAKEQVKSRALQVAEKLYFGGRRGFQPPHKASKISAGFSPGGTFNFTRNSEFFRSLFSP